MTLMEQLRKYSAPAELCEKMTDGRVRCLACAHKCLIPPDGSGVCKVRLNEGGILRVPWGYISGYGLDPVEKKPLFHVLPGALTFSFGMLGCNFKCSFCQNYLTSQVLRDPACHAGELAPATPEKLAASARDAGAAIIVSTYNEPLITAEWSLAVFKEARKYGIRAAYVSNGYASSEVLDYIKPHVQFYKADLKTFNGENYAKVAGGKLSNVLRAIEMVHAKGFWLEIVTLLIPGFNDGKEELESVAGFISGISRDIPWHVTAFYPTYNMTDRGATPPETLLKARDIGLKKGLKYVYTGNIPGQGYEDTLCSSCGKTLVTRRGFRILNNTIKITKKGTGLCAHCAAPIPGVWK
ncbi:MAG: AmmeMemoRadiSam system radical SAM enzyme [Elusimicrobia bacterium GWA2_56_46]|nr:MAG: AmmeMemoRadiSam system radical SAM enzyme [Elusimicrobia bacterium GWA2_56_46]OGR54412.1 MAG: AmmeMemoRadiSam system radical SAM enzyme [Elusimicrobia bacterium GWC2_56_31]HBB67427.1 AmmeMemoRadiSam system radical SAM enzyme [Elusimicrobiota bacterium]HBW22612.1 AmmeMemoRadiSam system radical SAM enzyme [Elusimicrobiota bacterium]